MTNVEYARSGLFLAAVRNAFYKLCKRKIGEEYCTTPCAVCEKAANTIKHIATTRQASKFRMGRGIVHKLAAS